MVEAAYFLREELHKYQMCCHPDCGGDAKTQVVIQQRDGAALYLGACDDPDHQQFTTALNFTLQKGVVTPAHLAEEGSIEIEGVYYKPPQHHNVKCKWTEWQRYLEEVEAEVVREAKFMASPKGKALAKQREENNDKPLVMEAVAEWTWIGNFDKWMDVEGNIVRMTALDTSELICAILAVRDANFSRVTKRIAWTKQLLVPEEKYIYPEEELNVGFEVAGDKLEEFQEAAEERGLL